MNMYRLHCHNTEELYDFIAQHHLAQYKHIFVQVAANKVDQLELRKMIGLLQRYLPQAQLFGVTYGEHFGFDDKFFICFTVFEKVSVHSVLLSYEEFANELELVTYISDTLITEETNLLLLFTDQNSNLHSLIRHIPLANEKTVVIAGRINEGERLFSHEGFVTGGMLAISFNGSAFRVQSSHPFLWEPVGTAFRITKCSGNKLYELDGKKAIKLLQRYLGKEFIDRLPFSGAEFPFIIEKNGHKECLSIVKVNEDGSIELNGYVHQGEKVKFSYVHLTSLVWTISDELNKLTKKYTEAIFFYRSIAVQGYAYPVLEQITTTLEQVAPTFTPFIFVELVIKDRDIRSATFSMLALSEGNQNGENSSASVSLSIPEMFQGVMTLANLMSTSSREMERLRVHVQISQSLFEHNTDIVYSTDLHGNFTNVNPAFEKILGYTKEEILHTNALKYMHPNDVPRVSRHFYRALRGKIQYYNLEIPTKSGETLLFQIKNVPIIVDGKKVGIYGIGRDITEQKKAEEKISYLAYYDPDTHLPNRTKFMEIIDEQLEKAKQKNRKLAVVFIDLDRFKLVNDSIGHYAGDEILKQVVQRIQHVLPAGAYLGRFHGDKFCLLLTERTDSEGVFKTAAHISKEVMKPIVYENKEFFITISIGISFYPNDGVDKHSLLKNADIALNKAKQSGGNRIQFYSAKMNEETLYRLEMERYLRKALENQEFFLCYQPIIDIHKGVIVGNEALIRWRHPKLGLVRPNEFISLAEETGLIHEIGRWVLVTACKQTKKWQQLWNQQLFVSVNVSARQFQHEGFIDDVKQALEQSQLSPNCLHLELTENSMLRNLHYSIQVMKELQQLGVGIAIDDFGSGYASFSYLKNLPVNILKIDRSFVEQMHTNSSDIAIVKAIITMGHGLGLKTVAEGVETVEQLELLKMLHCHHAQGYALYRPVTAEELSTYMTVSHK
uniref:Diguanylate cyclase/phosphodiesterase with PAS/PAC sensor(S) n=1 Tax=Geobacillus sp. (strain WCH70) TaxID=471223 RepID=C5D6R4_GEOSW